MPESVRPQNRVGRRGFLKGAGLAATAVLAGPVRAQAAQRQPGNLVTIAGGGSANVAGGETVATEVALLKPWGVVVAESGDIFFSDSAANTVYRVSRDGAIADVAGDAKQRLLFPTGLAFDASNRLLVCDTGNAKVVVLHPDGGISAIAGAGGPGYAGDGGPATAAQLAFPNAVACVARDVYIADTANFRIRRIDADGKISTALGTGVQGNGPDGPAIECAIGEVTAIAVTGAGALLVADRTYGCVRVLQNGMANTIHRSSRAADARADGKSVGNLHGVLACGNSIVFADAFNSVVRSIGADGSFHLLAGTGESEFSGDGYATKVALNQPIGLAASSSDCVVADSGNSRVRLIVGAVSQ